MAQIVLPAFYQLVCFLFFGGGGVVFLGGVLYLIT